jgi:GT2 family glycosyltransferase
VENLDDTLPDGSEILVVDDGSKDGSVERVPRRQGRIRIHHSAGIGVAKARNWGGHQARGDVLVFSDAHMGYDEYWWRALTEQLENPKVGAVAPGITALPANGPAGYGITFKGPAMEVRWLRRIPKAPTPVPILPGCCLAMRRNTFLRTGGAWDRGLLQRGNVDNEISVRLWLLGYELIVVPEVVRHRFRKRSPYPVAWPQYLHNRLRLAFVHFNPARLGNVVARLRNYPAFGEALSLLVDGDVTARRQHMISHRVRNDDWYFERFRINW